MMISIHKVLFPGIVAGCLFLVFAVTLISNPTIALASGSAPGGAMGRSTQASPGAAAGDQGSAMDSNANASKQAPPAPAKEQKKAAEGGECAISQQYPETIRKWCGQIERYASENGLEPNLLAAVMLQESGGNPRAYSKSGAVGLMQVMPKDGLAAKFMCVNGPCFSSRPSTEELYDPEFNISYGARMLAGLIQKYGDVREGLHSYGPNNMGYRYADIILSIMNKYR
jgi:hypothetical protein